MNHNATCENCGKEWKTQNKPERYCSMVCRATARTGESANRDVHILRDRAHSEGRASQLRKGEE